MHTGSAATAAVRLHVARLPSAPKRQGAVLATADGGLAAVSPLGPGEADASAVLQVASGCGAGFRVNVMADTCWRAVL